MYPATVFLKSSNSGTGSNIAMFLGSSSKSLAQWLQKLWVIETKNIPSTIFHLKRFLIFSLNKSILIFFCLLSVHTEGFDSLRAEEQKLLFCTRRSGEEDAALAEFPLQKGSKKYSRCTSILPYKGCSKPWPEVLLHFSYFPQLSCLGVF